MWELCFLSLLAGAQEGMGNLRFPMSCYTMQLSMVQAIGFWDPELSGIGEDYHTALRAYLHYKKEGAHPTASQHAATWA